MSPLRRTLAAMLAAVIPLTAVVGITTAARSVAAPQECASGVWVLVESDDASDFGCATSSDSGLDALESAGFEVETAAGLVNRIGGLPVNTDFGTNGNIYWSYWTATFDSATGAIGTWSEYQTGANQSQPPSGTVEGWHLTISAWPDPTEPPAATEVPQQAVSATSGSTTGSTTAATTAASTATTGATSTAPGATAASLTDAIAWIEDNLPTADDGVGSIADTIIALAAGQQCTSAEAIGDLIAELEASADSIAASPGSSAKAAIAAVAVGLDPTDFGGVDLIEAVLAGTSDAGQVGDWANPFTQALGIIALDRAGQSVPEAMVATLLGMQDASGAFGYEWGGFQADPDSTALAIQALVLVGGNGGAVDQALAWAAANQSVEGYWSSYSPVDTTSLLGYAVEAAGGDSADAASWLGGQQLSSGAFSNELDGTDANLMSTYNAVHLIAGASWMDASFDLGGCPATGDSDDSDDSDGSDNESLADTGANAATIAWGVAGIVMVALGGSAIAVRRRV